MEEPKNFQCKCQCHNQSHHHHFSKKHIHFRKTFLSKSYFIIFFISLILILGITIINTILTYNEVLLPRIFFPGLIIYIATFICAGGAAGSYGPAHHSELQLIQMRKCTSIVMLIICIIILPVFLIQNINLYSSIREAKSYCIENNGKSKGEIYNELFDEKEKLFSQNNNLKHKHKNGLTCFESQKCLKSISNSQIFVCNYNHQEKYNNSRCNKVFETENIVNTFDNANMASFAKSCIDLKNEKIRPNLDIYKCFSSKNLCKDDLVTNEEKKEIEKYFDKNNILLEQKIFDVQKKLEVFVDEMYSYDEKCLSGALYNFIFIVIILFILINLCLCFAWGAIAISNILKHFGYMEDSEMKYYEEKIRQMNNMYNKIHNQNDKEIIDENTPINVN